MATIPRPASAMGSRAIAASTPGRRGLSAAELREADSGIQVAIQKVHKDVERHEEDRNRENSTLNERGIALHDRRDQHAADPRNREDPLDADRATGTLRGLGPKARHCTDQTGRDDGPSRPD